MKHGYHRHIILLPREPVVGGGGVCMCVQAGRREFKGRCMHMRGGGRVCAYVWGEEMRGDGRGARGGEVC